VAEALRADLEALEKVFLSDRATKACESKGRRKEEPEDDYRTAFQRDRDRIVHAEAFRNLKAKTQVFLAPGGDRFRTRLTHTLEVSQVARSICRALRLNEDLAEAIALGHDVGHTPFAHAGESALKECVPGGFKHAQQSVRTLARLEKEGEGLNLSWEVEDGILRHSKGAKPLFDADPDKLPRTLEGQVVRIADAMAYVNHDIEDAVMVGVLDKNQLPQDAMELLGFKHSERIRTMVTDIVKTSKDSEFIVMSTEVGEATEAVKAWMYAHLYPSEPIAQRDAQAKHMVKSLYEWLLERPEQVPGYGKDPDSTKHRDVADYVCGLTDGEVYQLFQQIFMPQPW
jgi:dGTPase